MKTEKEIKTYLSSLQQPKRAELEQLHQHLLKLMPGSKLWFLDGKNEKGKVVSNPNIGYGQYTIRYADGKSKAFYQIGISANTSGISVYIMGLEDKTYLPKVYGKTIGKATVTSYCIKFKSLNEIHLDVLERAIMDGLEQTKE
ncbi:MAG: DUF1801 domain-containing protein [Bacteroidia bacterium]|nr:DUF1801 domain-containing protein [Bacteroidia bacterium]